jgi:hypothetical protein
MAAGKTGFSETGTGARLTAFSNLGAHAGVVPSAQQSIAGAENLAG